MVRTLAHDGLWELARMRAGWDRMGHSSVKELFQTLSLVPACVAQQRPHLETRYPNGMGQMVRTHGDY